MTIKELYKAFIGMHVI